MLAILLCAVLWRDADAEAAAKRLITQEAPLGSQIVIVASNAGLRSLADSELLARWLRSKGILKQTPWLKRTDEQSQAARRYDLEIMARFAAFAQSKFEGKTDEEIRKMLAVSAESEARTPIIQLYKENSPRLSSYFAELLDASEELIHVRTLPSTDSSGKEILIGLCLTRAYQEVVVYLFRFWVGSIYQEVRVIVFPPKVKLPAPRDGAGLFFTFAVC